MSAIAAMIGAGGAIAAGGLNLMGQQTQAGNQSAALQAAMQNYMLQKQMADQQYELSTAGQTDARGNRTMYVPGKGWETFLSPTSRRQIGQSDAQIQQAGTRNLSEGEFERTGAESRRLAAGDAAGPMLDAIRYNYGGPTKAGVVGSNKIADVTNATEGADQARSGFTAAALRTGQGGQQLESTLASIDKGATQGVRSALARDQAGGGALFDQMKTNFVKSKLDPYNALSATANNVENVPFAPENISGQLGTSSLNQGVAGQGSLARGAYGVNQSMGPLYAAMIGQKQPNYDTFAGGLANNIAALYRGWKGSGSTQPSYPGPATNDPSTWTGGF